MTFSRIALPILVAASVTVAGCTNPFSSSSSSSTSTSTTVTGSAVAGPVTGSLQVVDASGALVATATVSQGAFSVDIPNTAMAGELDFVVTGSYVDEASGQTVQLSTQAPLALRLAAGGGTQVCVTPETTVIREMVRTQAMTLTQAQTTFQNAFGYLPDMTATPFDVTAAMPTAATLADQQATFRVATMSQFGADLGLTAAAGLADLPAALADDLSDGTLDGLGSGGAAVSVGGVNLNQMNQTSTLAARFLTSMANFAASAQNVARVAYPTTGLPTVGISDALPATKTVTLTTGGQVQVKLEVANAAPFSTMGLGVSRATHRITLTDLSNVPVTIGGAGSPVASVSNRILMHMLDGMSHSTPMPTTNPTGVSTYTFDSYYLMASNMMMGTQTVPMGVWDVAVDLKDSLGNVIGTAMFHPNVMMAMGSDVFSQKGGDSGDMVTSAMGTSPRPYWVWLHNAQAAAGGGIDLTVFVSTKVGMMFPPLTAGMSMTSMGDTYTNTTVTVEVSVDGGTTWSAMTAQGMGMYMLNIPTWASTNAVQPQFRVTVDGRTPLTAAATNFALSFTIP